MSNGVSYWTLVFQQFVRNRQAMAGLAIVIFFFLLAFFAPFLAHNLPIYWIDAEGKGSYPLLREFFAPQETTEQMLEMGFNYALLFIPSSLLILWLFRRIAPHLSVQESRFATVATTIVFSLLIASLITYVLLPGKVSWTAGGWREVLLLWWKDFQLALRERPSTSILRLLLLVPLLLLSVGFWVSVMTTLQISLRGFGVLILGILLCLPFAITKRVKTPDPAFYRLAAAEGRGRGIFPLLPYGPTEQGFGKLLPPSWWQHGPQKDPSCKPGVHLLGTDNLGRDVLARIIHGARVSLSVGLATVAIASFLGIMIGSYAGYFGGWVDMVVSRAIEIVICVPTLFLILAIVAIVDERSIFNIMLVLGLTGWTGVARLIRGEVLKQKRLDYVASAEALGASANRIMFRHILPNAMGPALVSITFGVASAILTESTLSFLGLGVSPPTPTWGILLNEARQEGAQTYWWLAVFPGILLFLSVTAYNLVGEGLRDAMDPRLRR